MGPVATDLGKQISLYPDDNGGEQAAISNTLPAGRQGDGGRG